MQLYNVMTFVMEANKSKSPFSSAKKLRLIFFITVGILITLTVAFTYINYDLQKKNFLEQIDAKLFTAATMAKEVLSRDFHEKHNAPNTMSHAEYLEILKRNNNISKELGIQYIWSGIEVDKIIHVTSASSKNQSLDLNSYHHFWDIPLDTSSFQEAFQTMQKVVRNYESKWGKGRLVQIPFVNSKGQKFSFGASIDSALIEMQLNKNLERGLLLGLLFSCLGVLIGTLAFLAVQKSLNTVEKNEERTVNFERSLEAVERLTNAGGWRYHVESNKLTWSKRTYELHGIPVGKPITKDEAMDFYVDDDRERIRIDFQNCLDKRIPFDTHYKIFSQRDGGTYLMVRSSGQAHVNSNGVVTDIYGIFQDLSDVYRSLEEKQLLLKDLEHRTKNNFQIILGLIGLEKHKLNSNHSDAKESLNRISNQIFLLASMHDTLYSQNQLTVNDASTHLENIALSLYLNHKSSQTITQSNYSQKNVVIAPFQALYLSLAFNELLTNTVKHEIETTQKKISWGIFNNQTLNYFFYFDSGNFYLNPFTTPTPTALNGLGTTLIRLFCEKLNANYSFTSLKNSPIAIQEYISQNVLNPAPNNQHLFFIQFQKEGPRVT